MEKIHLIEMVDNAKEGENPREAFVHRLLRDVIETGAAEIVVDFHDPGESENPDVQRMIKSAIESICAKYCKTPVLGLLESVATMQKLNVIGALSYDDMKRTAIMMTKMEIASQQEELVKATGSEDMASLGIIAKSMGLMK